MGRLSWFECRFLLKKWVEVRGEYISLAGFDSGCETSNYQRYPVFTVPFQPVNSEILRENCRASMHRSWSGVGVYGQAG